MVFKSEFWSSAGRSTGNVVGEVGVVGVRTLIKYVWEEATKPLPLLLLLSKKSFFRSDL